jgi:hypothetical protein
MTDEEEEALERVKTDPSIQANATAIRIQKALRNLLIATAVCFAGLLAVAGYVYTVAHSNNVALCALRKDRQQTYDSTVKYLSDHPEGTKLISVADLQAAIVQAKGTLDALSGISCPAS